MIKRSIPKQADVARLAGVSRATVSQILNDKPGFSVPPETRERVLAAARTLDYLPNTAARNLRTRQTWTISVVIPDITNPFYPEYIRGIQDVAEDAGYDVIICNTDGQAAKERRFLGAMRQGRADGVIGVLWHAGADELRALIEREVSVTLLAPPAPDDLPIDRLYLDEAKAACHAVEHLLRKGHRKIAMVAGPHGVLAQRVAGYVTALTRAGLSPDVNVVHVADFTEAYGHDAARRLFAAPDRPSAIFAANDVMAMGILLAARESELRVPEDVALLGFDDIPAACLLAPALTTVRQFQYRLGRRSAQMFLERKSGEVSALHGRVEEMPFELVVRAST